MAGEINSGGAMEAAKNTAPRFVLEVEDQMLNVGVSSFIERVEYESCEGAIDVMKVSVLDPQGTISELKLFLPGNELSLWIGYGPNNSDLIHLGRAVITHSMGTFPVDGIPTIDVTAYTRDHFMTEVRPDPDPPPNVKPKSGKSKEKKVSWGNIELSTVVGAIASGLGFEPDVDETQAPKGSVYQPMKMSNFDFIRGLANLVGYYFWVDGDADGKWHLHFKNPESLLSEQEKSYKFVYNQGGRSTLLSFQPEMVFKGHFTKIQAQAKTKTGKTIRATFVEEKKHDWSTKPVELDEANEGEIGSAQQITLFIGEYSFQALHKGEIRDEATLQKWAEQWFKRHRQDFVLGNGEVIGVEDLRARQRHHIEGLGTLYDGEWEFTKVRHVFDAGSGYVCEIDGRKVIV
jgi:phage protein D